MYILAADLELARPISARAESAAKAGVPIQRFAKPIVRTGQYVKGKQKFDITEDDLARWVRNFAATKKNGFVVTIPDDHDTVGKTEHTYGQVDEIYQIGDTLHMIATITGAKGIKMALTVGTSIGVTERDWVDGDGRSYDGSVLHHVAMAPVPVVGGLGTFIPIELAQKKSSETDMMDIDKKALYGAFDLAADTKDKDVLAKITEAHKALADAAEADKAKVTELSQQVTDLKAAAKTRDSVTKLDDVTLNLARDNVGLKLDALVEKGRLTPAARKVFEKRFTEGEKIGMNLSQGGGMGFYDHVLEVLDANDPKELSQKSGAQSAVLPDKLKSGDTENPLLTDARRRAEAAK